MKQISLIILSLILFNFSTAFSQDAIAKTNDGQSVILRKNGCWIYYSPSIGNGQINQSPAQDTRATTLQGRIVILKKDGTWIMTNASQQPARQNPTDAVVAPIQNSKVAGLAKSRYWGGEKWETHHAMLDKPAPALELSEWMNAEIPQNAWTGNIVIVDFWATWCGPCRNSIPHNNEIFRRYKDQGVLLIGACSAGGRGGQERMGEVVEQIGLEYPTAKVSENYTQAWNVSFFPTYAIIDRRGNLRAIGVDPDSVEKIILALLEEPR